MIFVGLTISILLGFCLFRYFFSDAEWQKQPIGEAFGFSFLVGTAFQTVFMFIYDLIGIPITLMSITVASLICIAAIAFIFKNTLFSCFTNVSNFKIPPFGKWNFGWIIMFGCVAFLIVTSIIKSTFWPTTAYDAVAGYDLMGKVIAAEGKIKVSLFDIDAQGRRGIYPPLIEGSFAYAYLWGAETSKWITSLTFLSFALIFYAQLLRYTTALASIFFLLIMVATPEMYAHASLSLTNMPAAAFAGLGLIYVFMGIDKEKHSWIWIGAVFLACNVWARNDGVIFNLVGVLAVAWYAYKTKSYKMLFIFGAIAFLPLIVWSLYLRLNIGIVQDRFVNHLFWDSERFGLLMDWLWRLFSSTQYYGLTFVVFAIALLLNIRNLPKDKSLLLVILFVSFLLYTAVYYQLDDTKQDPLNTMMRASYKRAIFYYVPIVLFYAAVNQTMLMIFQKIENYRTGTISE